MVESVLTSMTHFADLTPYVYSDVEPEGAVNVGWLCDSHPFSRGPVDTRFIDALTRCSARRISIDRGTHRCELCSDDTMAPEGTGEIRVPGPDGRVYAAPSMLTHYVVDHGYLPPQPFIEATIAHAATLAVVSDDEREALGAMDRTRRYELCLDALRVLVERSPANAWLSEAHGLLAAVLPPIHAESRGEVTAAVRAARRHIMPSSATQPLHALVDNVLEVGDYVFGAADEASLQVTIAAVENLREQGISVEIPLA